MKKSFVHWIVPVSLSLGGMAVAQQAVPGPAPAAVEGVTGVKQEAVSSIKQLEKGTAAPTGGVTTGAKNDAQAVNKVNGVETINGVKADGRAVVPPPPPTNVPPPPPPPPQAITSGAKHDAQAVDKVTGVETTPPTSVAPPPPPPPAVHQAGTAAPVGGGAVGNAAKIQSVKGVTGLNTAKIQNLEAALQLKQGGETPAGTGQEKGGKGKAAAAALLGAPLEKPNPKAPKEDGRAGFQEFEKLQNLGS